MSDNFSDGDFSHNPTWTGDTSVFQVNSSKQLQLHDQAANRSFLSTPFLQSSLRNFEWNFFIRENFSPSANNYGRVYLVSDRDSLNGPLNGYYLQFGEAGNNDAVELFRQTGQGVQSVCRGANGQIARSFHVRVKVLRDSLANWSIWVDTTGGTNFVREAIAVDSVYGSSAYVGLSALYTSSNATKFYWDDFYAGPQRINPPPPPPPPAYIAQTYDVLINEVMAKPSPAVGLPPDEYVELYNRSSYPISLQNWTCSVDKKVRVFGQVTIFPDSFLILTSSSHASDFDPSLPVYGMSSFPALNNTGAEICLKNDSGRVISDLNYSDTWYRDKLKEKGGWSMERIDPGNPCGETDNWTASNDPSGGTPGRKNSVVASNPDHRAPMVNRAAVLGTDSIFVFFSESTDSLSLPDATLYTLNHGLSVKSVFPIGNDYKSLLLITSSPLQPGIIYSLQVNSAIRDCAGNRIVAGQTIHLGIPGKIQAGDLLINEILPAPRTGGVKYLELYNHSGGIRELKELVLCDQDSVSGLLTDQKSVSAQPYQLLPGEYVLLSPDGALVRQNYFCPDTSLFADMSSFPKMDVGGGTIALADMNGNVIDMLRYSSSMQFPLIGDSKGVSLERISFRRPTNDPDNWHSAAQTVGFGTPGYKNSEFMEDGDGQEVSLTDPLFSPDNDGYRDELNIHYSFDNPDYLANVTVFDSRGRFVRELVRNHLLGREGNFSWDGINQQREKAPVGIYLICFEVFDAKGNSHLYKRPCVLAAKL